MQTLNRPLSTHQAAIPPSQDESFTLSAADANAETLPPHLHNGAGC